MIYLDSQGVLILQHQKFKKKRREGAKILLKDLLIRMFVIVV